MGGVVEVAFPDLTARDSEVHVHRTWVTDVVLSEDALEPSGICVFIGAPIEDH